MEIVERCPECNRKMVQMDNPDEWLCIKHGVFNMRLEHEYEDEWDEDDDDMPEECIACGGPYPDCQSSCKLFDD